MKFHITLNKSPKVKKHQHIKNIQTLIMSYQTFQVLTTALFLYLSSSPTKLLEVSRAVLSAWTMLHLLSTWKIPIYSFSIQLLSVPLRRLSWPSLGDVNCSCLSVLISPLKLMITCFQLPH